MRNDLRATTRNLWKDFEEKVVRNVKENPKQFRQYGNSRTKMRVRVGNLIKDDNTIGTSDQEKADTLSMTFE